MVDEAIAKEVAAAAATDPAAAPAPEVQPATAPEPAVEAPEPAAAAPAPTALTVQVGDVLDRGTVFGVRRVRHGDLMQCSVSFGSGSAWVEF